MSARRGTHLASLSLDCPVLAHSSNSALQPEGEGPPPAEDAGAAVSRRVTSSEDDEAVKPTAPSEPRPGITQAVSAGLVSRHSDSVTTAESGVGQRGLVSSCGDKDGRLRGEVILPAFLPTGLTGSAMLPVECNPLACLSICRHQAPRDLRALFRRELRAFPDSFPIQQRSVRPHAAMALSQAMFHKVITGNHPLPFVSPLLAALVFLGNAAAAASTVAAMACACSAFLWSRLRRKSSLETFSSLLW